MSAALYLGAYLVITEKASEWNVCLGAWRSDGNSVASTIPGSLQKLGVSANGKAVTTSEPVRQEQKRRLEEQLILQRQRIPLRAQAPPLI